MATKCEQEVVALRIGFGWLRPCPLHFVPFSTKRWHFTSWNLHLNTRSESNISYIQWTWLKTYNLSRYRHGRLTSGRTQFSAKTKVPAVRKWLCALLLKVHSFALRYLKMPFVNDPRWPFYTHPSRENPKNSLPSSNLIWTLFSEFR